MQNILMVLLLLIVTIQAVPVSAETAESKGQAIALEADRRDNGWNDAESKLTMILRNRHGDESRREIRGKSLEVSGDGDKTLTIFDTPKDIKGTAFLNFTHKVGDDEQWLYLPALKRVKRIASRNKSGSFLGSEFAYEDIASQEVEKYSYKWLRDEVYLGMECFVVESYPVDKKHSGYTRLVSWVDKEHYRRWKTEFFDRKKSHLKTLTFADYKLYLGQYWRAEEMNMVNHQNGKSTQLIWNSYQFRTGLTDSDFTKNSLKRVK
ncbi:outer membrane lipoprotein-sorting protein [uncultured Shewanella sp.]|uniref:outer membrane lipoprotein-sorting protein n=1 Tax=Shewanella atlantica TaxID=271099 RepID=UPI00260F7457|nr:outer membrane lipoprotein-sorting protein [uncultured Shewanella sp.]